MNNDAQMNDENFRLLRDFVYEKSGIFFGDTKKYQLENRLSMRLRANNLDGFDKYYYLLKYDPGARKELSALFDSVTTKETSFFRSPQQIQAFKEKALPEILSQRIKDGKKTLQIWSAGCSTGEEPYTLAIIIRELLAKEISEWDIRIFATDLSKKALRSAKNAQYNEYSLRSVPPDIKKKYFSNTGGQYQVTDEIRTMVELQYLNLNDPRRVELMKETDIIFCRNVLIYFDDPAKIRFVSQLYDDLNPEGYLFIGHSESLHNISKAFKLVHFPGALAYKKE
ncbi:MAG: protein-glutamate O-methyltransferase CheR [Thermodesulfobacteriota bacterium]|nr:protein-glutamate O-methyltransferase CheR [Thermodesulfobacteriota bacterium]